MSRAALAAAMAVVLALPPLAQWFSATMPRHQLLQVPAMLVLGAFSMHGRGKRANTGAPAAASPAPIILAVGLMAFWMIPRSIDLAASNAVADQVMHASWFLAGAALAHTLPRAPAVVSMALGIHGVAMLGALGLVYSRYPGLICTAYDLEQQWAVGRTLLYAAPVLAVGLWGHAIRRMAAPTVDRPGGVEAASA